MGVALFLAALAYAFATPAWYYANTLFRNALMGFLLLAMTLLGARLLQAPSRSGALALLGLGLLAVAARTEYVVPVLVLGAFLALGTRRRLPRGVWLAWVAAPITLASLNLLYRGSSLNPISAEPWMGRWTLETPLVGLYGLTLAPGTGALLFAPPLLIALWGALSGSGGAEARAQRRVALVLAGSVFLVYAAYPAWSGVIAFGPRLIVPAFAPLMLLAAPAIDRALGAIRRPAWWPVWLLLLAGLAVNGSAALFHDGGHYIRIYERLGPNPLQEGLLSYRHLQASPALNQLRQWNWGQLRPVWMTATAGPREADWLYPLGLFAILGTFLGLLRLGPSAWLRRLSLLGTVEILPPSR